MASVILTNWTVYYADDAGAGAGYKQITWTGAGAPETTTNTVNELYSAIADLFSIAAQNNANDTIPIQAVTPTAYNIGSFDAGDLEPWFIDPVSIKHLTGGSIQTVGWERAFGGTGDIGIIKITRSGSTNIVAGDIGATITNTTGGDDGWLLYIEGNTLWIRPATNGTGDDWDTTGGANDLVCNGHTDTQATAGVSGERLWSNIYSIGTIESNTLLYVYQNFAQITGFWSDGHIDRLILVNDGFASGLIDSGLLTIYARQYTKLYDYYVADVSAGGRNPIPLATSADINNITGYRTFIGTGGSGTFNVGNYIYVGASWATATKKGVLTAVSSYTLTYYLIGDLSDFDSPDAVKEYVPTTGIDGDATCTAATPTNAGPKASPSSTVTISAGGILRDLNNGYGSAPYSIEINLQGTVGIEDFYERVKYVTRQGETTDIETQTSQSLIGQEYTAIGDLYIPYDTGSVDNPFTEGETITATGSFTCVLTSKHDQGASEGFIIVRNVRGTTPVDNTVLTEGASGHTALVDTNGGLDPVATISPSKTSPFGTFAGGKFFGARGVWLASVPGADANNYVLADSENVSQTPPASISLTINGVESGDRVSLFRAVDANGAVDKSMFTIDATQGGVGVSTIVINSAIPADTPAKTGPTGYLRVVRRDGSGNIIDEQRYTYESWSGSTFTLLSGTTTSYDYGTTDTVYVPYIDEQATGTSVSKSVTYVSDRFVVVRVRKKGIIPFEQKGVTTKITTSGFSATATRTTDSVVV